MLTPLISKSRESLPFDLPTVFFRKRKLTQFICRRGETPLHYSMRSGSVMKVNKLLAYGASPFTVGEQGSPLQVKELPPQFFRRAELHFLMVFR